MSSVSVSNDAVIQQAVELLKVNVLILVLHRTGTHSDLF